MAGVNRQFVASLPMPAASPIQRLQSDRDGMHGRRLQNDEIPPKRWPSNAVMSLQDVDAQQYFRSALGAVAAQVDMVAGERTLSADSVGHDPAQLSP